MGSQIRRKKASLRNIIKFVAEILNLINNFLDEKNSFIFESVEKGIIRGRYTIFGKKPDQKRGYPGHQEIELALVKAYELTDNEKYLKLSNRLEKILLL